VIGAKKKEFATSGGGELEGVGRNLTDPELRNASVLLGQWNTWTTKKGKSPQ